MILWKQKQGNSLPCSVCTQERNMHKAMYAVMLAMVFSGGSAVAANVDGLRTVITEDGNIMTHNLDENGIPQDVRVESDYIAPFAVLTTVGVLNPDPHTRVRGFFLYAPVVSSNSMKKGRLS